MDIWSVGGHCPNPQFIMDIITDFALIVSLWCPIIWPCVWIRCVYIWLSKNPINCIIRCVWGVLHVHSQAVVTAVSSAQAGSDQGINAGIKPVSASRHGAPLKIYSVTFAVFLRSDRALSNFVSSSNLFWMRSPGSSSSCSSGSIADIIFWWIADLWRGKGLLKNPHPAWTLVYVKYATRNQCCATNIYISI